MKNKKISNFLENPKTNWKYVLIIVILAFFVSGGILIYQRWIAEEIIKISEVEILHKITEKEESLAEKEFKKWGKIDSISNVEISVRENKLDKEKVDIFVKNLETNKEELFITLSDISKTAYFDAEFRNGHLYVLKRTVTEPQNWQFCKYTSPEDEGTILFTSEISAPFSVSPNESFLAIKGSGGESYFFRDTLVFINLDTGKEKEFNSRDLTTNELLSYQEEIPVQSSIWVTPGKWTQNSEGFYGFTELVTSADPPMASEASVFTINIKDWKIDKFQIPFEEGVIILHDLNLTREAILYERISDKLSFYFYDLRSDKKEIIIPYSAETFNKYCRGALDYVYPFNEDCSKRRLAPKWIDNNTISYLDFETGEEIIKEIE